MSKKVYLVTLHTGNSLTVHSHKFVRGREVVIEDEDLVNYLKGHPNFTIKSKMIDDKASSATATSRVVPPVKEESDEAGGAEDVEDGGMSAKTPVTNVAKAPVKRGKSSAQ